MVRVMDCWNSSSELRMHVIESLKNLELSPSKRRGQNFLVNLKTILFQVDQADINTKDIVLEIGGGMGNLSRCLAEKAKKLYVVETDKCLVKFLNDFMGSFSNVEVLHGDAVKIELPKFTKCVSNLPYQISSPITFRLLETNFDLAVLMYQKEFADRFFAKPNTKDYSRLTVMINLKANCKYLKTVKPNSFYPPPKVHSSIVAIEKKEKYELKDSKEFKYYVTLLFNHKKKTVRTVILNLFKAKVKQNIQINRKNIDSLPLLERRIFSLTLDELMQFYTELKEYVGEEVWSDIIFPSMK